MLRKAGSQLQGYIITQRLKRLHGNLFHREHHTLGDYGNSSLGWSNNSSWILLDLGNSRKTVSEHLCSNALLISRPPTSVSGVKRNMESLTPGHFVVAWTTELSSDTTISSNHRGPKNLWNNFNRIMNKFGHIFWRNISEHSNNAKNIMQQYTG